ncbi:MAG: low molecular weight phosphotyrosine protein phosphatase [Bacteroidales bacterium]|nr:low molecular weight phosphotyrosine protein phosphatase [Bacteroidales bacterium]
MKRIVFLCHGNICRSPMAEFVMKKLVKEAGREKEFDIDSMAVSGEEWGNPIYPPAKAKMREHGIPFGEHHAHKITPEEFAAADLIIIMDESNRRLLRRIVDEAADSPKVQMLMSYTGQHRDVADPWYTGDFETTYRDIIAGCTALLKALS